MYLPFGVLVGEQGAGVGARADDEAAVLPRHPLHGRPRAHDAVSGPEREVVQVLMHRVPRRQVT